MVKFFECYHCGVAVEQNHKSRHHTLCAPVGLPFSEDYFKFLYDGKYLYKVICQLCGFQIEHAEIHPKMGNHHKTIHPEKQFLKLVFNLDDILKCVGLKCPQCLIIIERNRLEKNPICPHGPWCDPDFLKRREMIQESTKSTPSQSESKKRRTDSFENETNISKRSNDNEVTSTANASNENEGSIKCEFCEKRIRSDRMEKHLQRKHSVNTIVLDSDEDDKNQQTKIKIEKQSPAERKVASKAIESSKSAEKLENEKEIEYYPIRVSKTALEQFLKEKRIFPKNGQFYLKDNH